MIEHESIITIVHFEERHAGKPVIVAVGYEAAARKTQLAPG